MTPERAPTDADGTLAELRVSEERFRTLLANIPGAMYRCGLDSNWDMEFISDNIESISGYPASEFIQSSVRTYASIIHPEDREGVEQTVGDAVTRGEPYILEYRIVAADGGVRWSTRRVRASSAPRKPSSGSTARSSTSRSGSSSRNSSRSKRSTTR